MMSGHGGVRGPASIRARQQRLARASLETITRFAIDFKISPEGSSHNTNRVSARPQPHRKAYIDFELRAVPSIASALEQPRSSVYLQHNNANINITGPMPQSIESMKSMANPWLLCITADDPILSVGVVSIVSRCK
ncbi:MAG: hypothetical protein H6876_00580 [Hyphomicrobiaceae bacterium]|nr:hypothetical protein [Hyphomicrobiaceae bacterium]